MKVKKITFSIFILAILSNFLGCAGNNKTVHDYIISGNLQEVRNYITNTKTVNDKNVLGNAPLHTAAQSGHLEIVRHLLSQGANINDKGETGDTPLHIAAQFSHLETVKYLLNQGADVNAQNYGGRNPLFYAVQGKNYGIVDILISKGVVVDSTDKNGETPLFECAVSSCPIKIAELLISKGANVNTKNYNLSTPLHYSSQKNNITLSNLLISKGADPTAKDRTQVTPEEIRKIARLASIDSVNETSYQKDSKNYDAKTDFGKYYALIIGNNDYQYLQKLKTAKSDALSVANILRDKYQFQVDVIINAKRSDILVALNKYRKNLKREDNLLIYYAGHGILDKEGDEGYWLPVDATDNDQVNWISNSSVTSNIKAMDAKHVMIVADSCYAGKLTRGLEVREKSTGYLSRLAQKRSRVVLSSGGLEPVIDGGGKGNHSIFAEAFINALNDNDEILDGHELFTKIRRPVMVNADQTPEYADIRKADHEGGDFLFIPSKK